MNKDEDYICFYRDAVIAGHDAPAAETMRRFKLMPCLTELLRKNKSAPDHTQGMDIARLWHWRNSFYKPSIGLALIFGIGASRRHGLSMARTCIQAAADTEPIWERQRRQNHRK